MRAGLMGDYNSPETIRKTNKWTYGEKSSLLVRRTSSDFIKMDDLDKVEEIVEKITLDDAFKISGIDEPYKYKDEIRKKLNDSELVLYTSTLKSINSSPFLTKEEKAKEMATLIVEILKDEGSTQIDPENNFLTQINKALGFLEEKEYAGEKPVTEEISLDDAFEISGIEKPDNYEIGVIEKLSDSEFDIYSDTLNAINSSPFLTKEEKAKEMATLIVEILKDEGSTEIDPEIDPEIERKNYFSTQITKALNFLKEKEDAGEKPVTEEITLDDAFEISGIEEPYNYEIELRGKLNDSEFGLYSATLNAINSSPFLTKEEKAKEMATLIVEILKYEGSTQTDPEIEQENNFSTQIKKALDFLKEKEAAGEKHVTIKKKPGNTIYVRIEEDVWGESYLFSHSIIEKIERINLEDVDIQSYNLYNDDVPLYKPSLGLQSVNVRISITNPEFLQSAREELFSVFVKPKIVSIILPDLDIIQNNSKTWSGALETYEEFILDSIEEETFNDITTFIIKLKKEFGFINKRDTKYKFKDGPVSTHVKGSEIIVSMKMRKDHSSRININNRLYEPFSKYGKEIMKYRWLTDTEDFCLIFDGESGNVYATDISPPSKALDEYFNMKYSKSNLEEYFCDVSREVNRSLSDWVEEEYLIFDSVRDNNIFVSGDYTDDEEVIAIREVKNEQILF